jgi:hypothetical protein
VNEHWQRGSPHVPPAPRRFSLWRSSGLQDMVRHLAALLVVEKLENEASLSCSTVRYHSPAQQGRRTMSIRCGGFPAVVVEMRRNQRAYQQRRGVLADSEPPRSVPRVWRSEPCRGRSRPAPKLFLLGCMPINRRGPWRLPSCAGVFVVANGRAASQWALWTRWGTTFTVEQRGCRVDGRGAAYHRRAERSTGG